MAVLDNALQALFKMAHWEILWQNASPTSSFAAQSVAINNIDDYNIFYILHVNTKSTFDFTAVTGDLIQFTEVGRAVLVYGAYVKGDSTEERGANAYRFLSKNGNAIEFDVGYKTVINSYLNVASDVYACAPYIIYGGKT